MRIPKYLRVSKKLFLYTLLMQLGFFAFGMVMVVIINAFFNEDMDYACMGTIMALCGILAGEIAQEVLDGTGKEHDPYGADPEERAQIRERLRPWRAQLPEYRDIFDGLTE